MADRIAAALEAVRDERTFCAFLMVLSEDWYLEQAEIRRSPPPPFSDGPRGWCNGTIGAVLEAAASGGRSMNCQPATSAEDAWKKAAEIIYLGKAYE